MILIYFFDTGGELLEQFNLDSIQAADHACKAFADRPGRSAFYEGDASTGGATGGYWNDGQAPQFTRRAGPSRTARTPFFCDVHKFNPPDLMPDPWCPFCEAEEGRLANGGVS